MTLYEWCIENKSEHILKEWNPYKNNNLTPHDVSYGSKKNIWWILPYDDPDTGKHFDFEWQAVVRDRTCFSRNCPYISTSNQRVYKGYNDFETKYPELAIYWGKNNDILPSEIHYRSVKSVWWEYPYDDPNTGKHFDFVWKASPYDISRTKGVCPYLSNAKVWAGYNDFESNYYELAKEWHPTKNGKLTPRDVTVKSSISVWWILPYDDPNTGKHFDFEWKARIADRVKGTGCPYLSNPSKALYYGFNDLETLYPNLAKEWHPTKNGNLKPSEVLSGSKKNVWWIKHYDDPITGKHFDFEWKTKIVTRCLGGADCPYLPTAANRQVWKGYNDLQTLNPDLAKEWHPIKNGNLKPEDVTSGSTKKVWWLLSYDVPNDYPIKHLRGKHFDFEWQAAINNRHKGETCPYLIGRKIYKGFNDLATAYPEIAKEWHPTKNGKITPQDITSNCGYKAWWQIKYKDAYTGITNTYEWQAYVYSRVGNKTKCPHLKGSSTERYIYTLLKRINISFEIEKKFDDTGKCRFDIYIPKYNFIIEPDGIQHFVNSFGDTPEKWKKYCERDRIKNNYCLKNNIKILRLPYIYDIDKDKDKIRDIILNFLNNQIVPMEILEFYKNIEFSNYYDVASKLNAA